VTDISQVYLFEVCRLTFNDDYDVIDIVKNYRIELILFCYYKFLRERLHERKNFAINTNSHYNGKFHLQIQ